MCRKPRSGSPYSGQDKPSSKPSLLLWHRGDTTCDRWWRNWAFNICSHFRAEEALHQREDCSKVSWEQHTSIGSLGDGSYHAYVLSAPASAPVCVTEYLPLIAEGLALHLLSLLICQPSICTLLHKFNLNQTEKKGHIKKPRNGIWIC